MNHICKKIFGTRNCVTARYGKVLNICNVMRCGISTVTVRGEQIFTNAKYGYSAMEVKSAVAGRRLASSCAVPKIARSTTGTGDQDNSGSSGEKNKGIEKIMIRLPWAERMPKLAFLLTNVINRAECERYVNITKQIGYSSDNDEDTSKGGMCLWESKEEAMRLLSTIKPYIPRQWYEGMQMSGLHNILQFERYKAGELSNPRRDGAHLRARGEISYLTFLLFLNDVEDGGITSLVSPPICDNTIGIQEAQPAERVDIYPRAGTVLIFQNDIFYENMKPLSGTKYVLKGEILYSKMSKNPFQNFPPVRGFFSGRSADLSDHDKSCAVIQPTTWFSSNNVPTEMNKSPSKPRGIPFYLPQKKEFIYVG